MINFKYPVKNFQKMKKILTAFFLLFSFHSFAQVAQYRAINGTLFLNISKNGEAYRFVNKNILVNIDYTSGNFLLKLSNTDLYQPDSTNISRLSDTISPQQYVFSGILPVNDILNQQTNVQNYNIELQLTNDNIGLDQTINLDMTITLPFASGRSNYRVFDMKGMLYNDQLQLPALIDFDNEIQFWIQFAGISTSN